MPSIASMARAWPTFSATCKRPSANCRPANMPRRPNRSSRSCSASRKVGGGVPNCWGTSCRSCSPAWGSAWFNLLSATDFTGRRRDLTHDGNHQLTQQRWFDASNNPLNTLTYSYDPNGNLSTAGNSFGTNAMTYDQVDRLASMAEPVGLTLSYGYDAAGNQTSIQDSQGGTVTSVYDAAN